MADTDYATTPQQVDFARKMAEALLQRQFVLSPEMAKTPNSWMYGIPHVLNALAGTQYRDQAQGGEIQGRNAGAASLSKAYTPFLSPNGAPMSTPGAQQGNLGQQSPAGNDAAKATYNYFIHKGWSPEQASGIAANIHHESNFNPGAVGDNGQSYGLAQWNGDRRANFSKVMGKPIEQSTFQDQLDYLHHELTQGNEKTAGDILRKANDPFTAGGLVSNLYERPRKNQYASRGRTAQSFYNTFANQNPDAAPDTAKLAEGRMNLGGPQPDVTGQGVLQPDITGQGAGRPGASPPGSTLGLPGSPPASEMPPGAARVAQAGPQPSSGLPGKGLPNPLQHPMSNMSQQQLQSILANPWVPDTTKQKLQDEIVKFGTPSMIPTEGGNIMFNSMTGEKTFIPEPKFSKLQMGDTAVDAVSTYDPNTKQWHTRIMAPGANNAGQNQPQAAPQPGNVPGKRADKSTLEPDFSSIGGMRRSGLDYQNVAKEELGTTEGLVKNRVKYVDEAVETGNRAKDALKNLQVMAGAEALGGDKLPSGPWANKSLRVKQAITELFPNFAPESVPPAEIINKLGVQLSGAAAKADFGSNVAQSEFNRYLETGTPSLMQSPQGRRMLLDIMMQDAQRRIDIRNMAIKADSPKEFFEKEKQYYENPRYGIKLRFGSRQINSMDAQPGEITKFLEDNIGKSKSSAPAARPLNGQSWRPMGQDSEGWVTKPNGVKIKRVD